MKINNTNSSGNTNLKPKLILNATVRTTNLGPLTNVKSIYIYIFRDQYNRILVLNLLD